jgi:iron-sulfur cluster assembly protein
LTITEKARKQLSQLLNTGECLEIGLRAGGCNGLMITLEKVSSSSTSELNIEKNIKYADQTSLKYLKGGIVDYEDEGFSKRFVVNPGEGTRKCGCGDSIAVPQM